VTGDSLTYPGEFEVLRTKADAGLWDTGELLVTNYRVSWTPKSRFNNTAAFSFDLDKVASVRQLRSVKYLFMAPALRFTLRDGTVYEIYNPKEDAARLRHVVDDYRARERYRPGSLFGGGT
jgi:hypothetical protein